MSPILLVVLIAVAVGFVAGGTLRAFESLKLHWWGLAVAGLGMQIVPIPASPFLSPRGWAALTLILSYVLLLVVIALNRRIPAAGAMALGLMMNLVVVGANAGMPVSADAIRTAGGAVDSVNGFASAKHHLMTEEDVLTILGDIIPLPAPIGVVLSIGDLFLYGGIAWFVVQIMRGRNRANPRPLAMWFPSYRGKHAPGHWRLASRDRASRAATEQPGNEL